MRQISLAAGLDETSVKQIMKGRSRSPQGRTLSAIAKVIDADVTELLEANHPNKRTNVPKGGARIARNAPVLPDHTAMPRDVPVLGSAPGGPDGGFFVNLLDPPVDWTRRPLALIGLTTVFAFYMEGGSMAPWRMPGAMIYASRTRPPQIGSHVVVVMHPVRPGGPTMCHVKKLIDRTDQEIQVEQYSPPSVGSFCADQVAEVLRIIEWEEVLGL